MRKIALAVFLILGTVLWYPGCDDTREGVSIPDVEGKWSLYILPPDSELVTYTVEVSLPGGSGTAEVTTRSSQGDDTGPVVVDANTALAIGNCGVTIMFSDTTGEPLWLVEGDVWRVHVWGELILSPVAELENSSTVFQVSSGGIYTCKPPRCASGLYEAGVQVALEDQAELMGAQAEFPFIRVSQDSAGFSGALPEISVLSLNLVGHESGDTINLSYHRKIDWDGEGADFFIVRIFNGSHLDIGEEVDASDLEDKGADRFIALTFQAEGDTLQIDFIFGLSGTEDSIWLDEVEEKVNVLDAFTDYFSSTTFKDDLPGEDVRWKARTPGKMVGDLGISDYKALEGTYSVLAQGGAERALTGYILTSSLSLGILGGLSGLNLGDIFQIGMNLADLSGINFSIVEEERAGFYSNFAGALEGEDLILGTFRGEAADHSCVEEGNFFATIDR